jgi:hypothetical protein
MVEPWLRGTLQELEPVRRAVLHALELALEDAERWCSSLNQEQMFARPADLPPVAFQMRHIVRSLDRLLSYAEGKALDEAQRVALQTEMDGASTAQVWSEFRAGLAQTMDRVRAVPPATFGEVRWVGSERLETTVAGLLIHCAEHTQRHAGQMVTTTKVVFGAKVGD